MKILLTGASSFTGMWFARELALAGHTVVTTLLRSRNQYAGTRGERIDILANHCHCIPECPFGSECFLNLIASEEWDLLCHHAADVTNYKSPDFDYVRALSNNTHNITGVLEALQKKNCSRIILTGSVFEQREGKGTEPLRAFSPYGLSKGLTSDAFQYHCAIKGFSLGKFVIPNPFGPYEEERFTSYLAKHWLEGKRTPIACPDYIRDNIHVSLLAKTYRQFVEHAVSHSGFFKTNPSEYAGTQAEFTSKFAEEMRSRLGVPCEFDIHVQKDFSEPLERLNTDKVDEKALGWNEKAAWDDLAAYYQKKYQPSAGVL